MTYIILVFPLLTLNKKMPGARLKLVCFLQILVTINFSEQKQAFTGNTCNSTEKNVITCVFLRNLQNFSGQFLIEHPGKYFYKQSASLC